jgi:hypothetical protein
MFRPRHNANAMVHHGHSCNFCPDHMMASTGDDLSLSIGLCNYLLLFDPVFTAQGELLATHRHGMHGDTAKHCHEEIWARVELVERRPRRQEITLLV